MIDPADCQPWQGYIAPTGYGRRRLGGTRMNAHRAAYIEARGDVPEGLVIDHLCRNRLCVNPDHLEAVTQAENVRRGDLTEFTVEQARAIRDEATPAPEAAAHFGVAVSTVYKIRAGLRWAEPGMVLRPPGYYNGRRQDRPAAVEHSAQEEVA